MGVIGSKESRVELVSRLGRLKAQEDAVRAQRGFLSYRLEQVVSEQDRIRRQLQHRRERA